MSELDTRSSLCYAKIGYIKLCKNHKATPQIKNKIIQNLKLIFSKELQSNIYNG